MKRNEINDEVWEAKEVMGLKVHQDDDKETNSLTYWSAIVLVR
jgi:hypothetical protein